MRRLILSCSLVALYSSHVGAASFDCSKASLPTEKAICSDYSLSKLDETIGEAYKRVFAKNPDIKQSQIDWVKNTRSCASSSDIKGCLKGAYEGRLDALNQLADKKPGWLGFQIDNVLQTPKGTAILVGKVASGSPAEVAGLQFGDFIYQINGKPIVDAAKVIPLLSFSPGDDVLFGVLTKNHTKSELHLKAGVQPSAAISYPNEVANTEAQESTKDQVSSKEEVTNEPTQDAESINLENAKAPLPKAQPVDSTNSETEKEPSSSGDSFFAFILTFVLIAGGAIFIFLRKRNLVNTPKIDRVKAPSKTKAVEMTRVIEEPAIAHKAPEKEVFVKEQVVVDTDAAANKVKRVSKDAESSKNTNKLSLKDLVNVSPPADSEAPPAESQLKLSKQPAASGLKFDVVVMDGDNEVLSLPLSYEMVANVVSNLSDSKDNDELFNLVAHHPASSVRANVGCKDALSKETLFMLAQDSSVEVLRSIVRSSAFREFATEALLKNLIGQDTEVAQSIARNADYFEQVSVKEVARVINATNDPSIIGSLDEQRRETDKINVQDEDVTDDRPDLSPIKVCSFCFSEGEKDRFYWLSEDGTACICSECGLEYAKATLDVLNSRNSDNSNTQENSSELDELCDAVGDKLMETGYLTSCVEDGDLAAVSINVESEDGLFRININVVVDDRQSSELSPDEEENICDTFDTFLDQRDLKSSFADLGYDIDDNFEGYYAHLVE